MKPNKIVDKKAESRQGWCFAIGLFTAFIAFGCFSDGGIGAGLVWTLISGGLFWGGASIKTTYIEDVRISRYR